MKMNAFIRKRSVAISLNSEGSDVRPNGAPTLEIFSYFNHVWASKYAKTEELSFSFSCSSAPLVLFVC